MPSSLYERRRIVEQRLAGLHSDWAAAQRQIGRTLGDVDRARLQRQADDLDAEIVAVEQKLASLEHGQASSDHLYRHWELRLPEMDFRKAAAVFADVQRHLDAEGGAALLLLQNYTAMGGKWFVARIREALNKTGPLDSVEIELAVGTPLSPLFFLNHLGQWLGCPPYLEGADLGEYIARLFEMLPKRLQSGSVVLIELRLWDAVGLSQEFLPWFVEALWCPLVEFLPKLAACHPLIKIIMVISANTPLPGVLPAGIACTVSDFDSRRVVELPLELWTVEDIKRWLLQYAGLTAPAIGLTPTQIEEAARTIHIAGGSGQPALVHMTLMQALQAYFP